MWTSTWVLHINLEQVNLSILEQAGNSRPNTVESGSTPLSRNVREPARGGSQQGTIFTHAIYL